MKIEVIYIDDSFDEFEEYLEKYEIINNCLKLSLYYKEWSYIWIPICNIKRFEVWK